ncbi:hypothetical protein B0J11DRAFT_139174 [Dendryphion nanum]|uniref:MARVEL domain-containing protein n=1 Tax=Dendryphion nanum TaxID=256645 RepID=A0A9P9D7D5_9PLEO|nr:hypothetical protein B0J11DRAFT_139174 [Dendryphion nanum]
MNKPGRSQSIAASEASTRKPTTTPQQAYYDATQPPQTHFITPKTFRAAIGARLDNPIVSVFRLATRVLQLIFALVAGISYASDMQKSNTSSRAGSSFIYAQVVFGLTLITLCIDSLLIHTYRLIWMVEWLLTVLWMTLFGVFYVIYYVDSIEPEYAGVNIGRMKRTVWCDLVSGLLWMSSALFSTTMCCSGLRAKIRGKKEAWREKKAVKKGKRAERETDVGRMEQGMLRKEEGLPGYEELPLEAK